MKVIIAGSRALTDYNLLLRAIGDFPHVITEIISGGATGADQLGEQWARHTQRPIKTFPTDWRAYGKKAGPMRNRAMSQYADALIALWNGQSKGTEDMIKQARKAGLIVHIHRPEAETRHLRSVSTQCRAAVWHPEQLRYTGRGQTRLRATPHQGALLCHQHRHCTTPSYDVGRDELEIDCF